MKMRSILVWLLSLCMLASIHHSAKLPVVKDVNVTAGNPIVLTCTLEAGTREITLVRWFKKNPEKLLATWQRINGSPEMSVQPEVREKIDIIDHKTIQIRNTLTDDSGLYHYEVFHDSTGLTTGGVVLNVLPASRTTGATVLTTEPLPQEEISVTKIKLDVTAPTQPAIVDKAAIFVLLPLVAALLLALFVGSLIFLLKRKRRHNRRHRNNGGSNELHPLVNRIYNNLIADFRQAYVANFSTICPDPSNTIIAVSTDKFYLDLQMVNIDDTKHKIIDIVSYKDVFTESGMGSHRVALYAPAGCGKTILCQVIAYCWAKDGSLGDKYDLIVFLSLRGYSKSDDIINMIINQYLPNRKGEQEHIADLIKRKSGKILFVLDGYDELIESESNAGDSKNQYTVQDLFNHQLQHILVSTRPTQLSDLKVSAKMNTKVKIKGFAELQAICFIKNYCGVRQIVFLKDPSIPIEIVIMKELKEKRLVSLSKNPQQLQMVCDYMRNHDETSSSLTQLYENFYETNLDYFIQKVAQDPTHAKRLDFDLESYQELFGKLQHLALYGFVHGRLIYDKHMYRKLLGERFVQLFDKLGVVYFEEVLGGSRTVMGFRHKSHQEFFAAKFLFFYLILHTQTGAYPQEINLASEQLQDLKRAVRYERIFIFMAGMSRDEGDARRIMGFITNLMKQLPNYFHQQSASDIHDSEDLPRQLIMMQVKCALEMGAANKDNDKEFITNLIQCLPYSQHVAPPDVNAEAAEYQEDDTDDISVPESKPAFHTIFAPEIFERNANVRSLPGQSKPVESGLVLDEKSHNPVPETVQENSKAAYWFRMKRESNKCDLRIDCLALPESMLNTPYPPLKGSSQCFFSSSIHDGLEHIMITYSSVELVAVDCGMNDLNKIKQLTERYNIHRYICFIYTCHDISVKIDSQNESEYIDCCNETKRPLVQLMESKHELCSKVCVQHCKNEELEASGFLNYLTETKAAKEKSEPSRTSFLSDQPPRGQILRVEKSDEPLKPETVQRLENSGVIVEITETSSDIQANWPDVAVPSCMVGGSKLCQFQVPDTIWGLVITKEGNITLCEREPGDTHRIRVYRQNNERAHQLESFDLPNGCRTLSISKCADKVLVPDLHNGSMHILTTVGVPDTSKLQLQPWYISCTSQHVWMYSRDKHVYKGVINDRNEVCDTVRMTESFKEHHNGVRNIAISKDNCKVALCYGISHKVQVYDSAGGLLHVYGGEKGKGPNQLYEPCDVCFDDHDNLFIADSDNKRIVVVGPDGHCAGYVHVGGRPHYVDVSGDMLAVADWGTTVFTYRLHWY